MKVFELGKVEDGMTITRERRRNLLPDDGSCPAFCSVLAFYVPGHTHKSALESCISRMGIFHHTVHHLVRLGDDED